MQSARTDILAPLVDVIGDGRNTDKAVVGEVDFDTLGSQQRPVLLAQRGVGFLQYAYEVIYGKRGQLDSIRQPTLQFWDEVRRLGKVKRARGNEQDVIRFDHAVFRRNRTPFDQRQ